MKEQTNGALEQNKGAQTLNQTNINNGCLTKKQKQYNEVKIFFSTHGAGTTGHSHTKN